MSYSTDKMRSYMKAHYDKRRKEAIDKLGGCCVVCGSKEDLQFDHIDSHTKVAPIAKLWRASLVRFVTELVKCQLLCVDCHVRKSRPELSQAAKKLAVIRREAALVDLVCGTCGDTFSRMRGRVRTAVCYCSRRCAGVANALIAQQAEQPPFKRTVEGSTPPGRTTGS